MAAASAHVLAVDDNATIRKAISMRLGSKGFDVTTATNGAEALDLINREPFDLVLLDLQMPGMRGDEVLREVRTRFTETQLPVIMLAASDDKNDITRTLELGANDYVIKPGDLPILIARINTQLSLKNTIAELERNHYTSTVATPQAEVNDETSLKQGLVKLDQLQYPEPIPYRRVYDDMPVACFLLDRHGLILTVNRFAATFFEYTREDMLRHSVLDFYASDERAQASQFFSDVVDSPERIHTWEVCRRKKSGSYVWVRETARSIVESGKEPRILLTCEDIDENYRLTEKITHQATHDELTGLANRKAFEARLQQVIESSHAERSEHVLVYLDLDQFKIINDTCGHMAGDNLLQEFSKLLRSTTKKRDTISRMGGDEFAILMEDSTTDRALEEIAQIRNAIANFSFLWGNKQYKITASVGVVRINYESESVSSVLSMADTACYAAKDSGRDRVHVYQPDDNRVVARRGEMLWATRIQDALRENRFTLNFQTITPLSNAHQGEHYELLVRMRDEMGKIVPPGEFLPSAERYNLADKLDQWVIQRAMKWLRTHPAQLDKLHLCSINLSGQSMGNEDILKFILDQLRTMEIPPHKICFEVTETAAIADLGSATRFISQLKDRGCRFALDDFGSGFSSFTYLKNLPVDYLKIDGTFVQDIARDSIDLAMVRSINEIGHVMAKQTIAEFVEDERILHKLREVGVDYAQGYAIARPRPLEEKY